MADKTVRLTHTNGATVVVSQDKADRLVASGLFTPARTTSTSKITK